MSGFGGFTTRPAGRTCLARRPQVPKQTGEYPWIETPVRNFGDYIVYVQLTPDCGQGSITSTAWLVRPVSDGNPVLVQVAPSGSACGAAPPRGKVQTSTAGVGVPLASGTPTLLTVTGMEGVGGSFHIGCAEDESGNLVYSAVDTPDA